MIRLPRYASDTEIITRGKRENAWRRISLSIKPIQDSFDIRKAAYFGINTLHTSVSSNNDTATLKKLHNS